MKSYTDLEQSKKLAEILPIESADMSWASNGFGKPFARTIPIKGYPEELCACWSLSALLSVLPDSIYDSTNEFSQLEFTKKSVAYIHGTTEGVKIGALKDNLVDACVDIITRLHELKLL